jgi:hypothetical protein
LAVVGLAVVVVGLAVVAVGLAVGEPPVKFILNPNSKRKRLAMAKTLK